MDDTPDAFAFTPLVDVDLGTTVFSNIVTLAGFIDQLIAQVSSAADAELLVGGTLAGTTAVVSAGDTIQIRMTAPSAFSAQETALVAVGQTSATWVVATKEVIEVTITSNVNDVVVAQLFGDPTQAGRFRVTIASGAVVCASSRSNAALRTGTFPGGSELEIVNNGRIQGKGGKGGNAPPCTNCSLQPGEAGGPALEVTMSITVVNNGDIWGGGGGGQGSAAWWNHGAGGGGGAGCDPGAGGSASTGDQGGRNTVGQGAGQPGTLTAGGTGGVTSTGGLETLCGGSGGGPGEAGFNGSNDRCSNRDAIRSGGAAGAAVVGDAMILWTAVGGRLGPIL
ncbi:MAG: hypothetical protein V3T05_14125 [Myxococcota bacterium]